MYYIARGGVSTDVESVGGGFSPLCVGNIPGAAGETHSSPIRDYKHVGASGVLLGFSLGCTQHSQGLTWQCLLSLAHVTQG